MIHVATALMFDKNNKLLIYLRDNIQTIPFPNQWDLFGGHVEAGETPEQALVREIQEELGITISSFTNFKTYECLIGDVKPNIKHVFVIKTDLDADSLTLHEGQRHISIPLAERGAYQFANILGQILDDYADSLVISLNTPL